MENLAEIVGKNLASLRKARGLTQQDLAEKINYSDKSISKWELGYSIPGVDVLKDFAEFYGVSIDYLVAEQKQEDLETVASQGTRQKNVNRGLIIAMTVAFVVLVIICVFFSGYYSPFAHNPAPEQNRKSLWVLFVWMVPITLFLVFFEVRHFWHNKIANVSIASCFIWTILISFAIQFQYWNDPSENVWYILVVGIPIQVILILMLGMNLKPKKKFPR